MSDSRGFVSVSCILVSDSRGFWFLIRGIVVSDLRVLVSDSLLLIPGKFLIRGLFHFGQYFNITNDLGRCPDMGYISPQIAKCGLSHWNLGQIFDRVYKGDATQKWVTDSLFYLPFLGAILCLMSCWCHSIHETHKQSNVTVVSGTLEKQAKTTK